MDLKIKISKNILKYLIFIGAAIIIFFSIPKEGKFKFEYEKNQPWQHDDLIAPYSFPVLKTKNEIDTEKQKVRNSFNPYFNKDTSILKEIIQQIKQIPLNLAADNSNPAEKNISYTKLLSIVNRVYEIGVIADEELMNIKRKNLVLKILIGKLMEEVPGEEVFTVSSAKIFITAQLENEKEIKPYFSPEKITSLVKQNIFYNKDLSDTKLEDELASISHNKGLVSEGEKIISRGNIVTPEKYQVLESLRSEYKTHLNTGNLNAYLYTGYLIFILLILTGFIFFLFINYKEIFRSNKQLMLIFSTITVFIFISAVVVRMHSTSIYVIPYCILPILLLCFFDRTVTLFAFLSTIIISSLFAPNNYEFIFVEIIVGLAVLLGISRVRYLSGFILIALYILALYLVTYSGFKLLQITSWREIDFKTYLMFAANFGLTLLAYPLIYVFEKIFGFVSDITLLELSDVNSKLLRELSMKAPGTFQHSLQVANIAEAVINRIGGNSLLARTGALYHDIGKLYAPQFFIENQKVFNPHLDLDEKDSSVKIRDHVLKGIEMARQHNIPKEIVTFIRTHHGTTRTEYFYKNYIKKLNEQQINDLEFRYIGPKPISKEAAIVMIADSIEAATRSLKDPTEQSINELVDKMIDLKLNDKQLEYAQITFREITITREIIKKIMISIYHGRIEYPASL